MSELIAIAGVDGEVTSHAIFFHGLGGHPHNTWLSSAEPQVCWLKWLAEDIKGLAVWTVGYSASVSRWRGSAMHLTDRATNLLERILLEPKINTGVISLIGHSLGGLVIKQLLRTADSMAHQRQDVADFIQRVQRVIFLATPHSSAGLATLADWLRIFIRPSLATASLARNDPNLRDLNLWYREWSSKQGIEHLILSESQSTRIAGLIVKPDSSDPGLSPRPISIDADHISICKPQDRSSEVYAHIRNFIKRPLHTTRPDVLIEDLLKTQTARIETLISSTLESNSHPPRQYSKELVDNEIERHLSIIRRARFFEGFGRTEHSLWLAERILKGEFEGGSDAVKSRALAWCSRILSVADSNSKADELLTRAKQLGDGPEIVVADAFNVSAKGDLEGALDKLSNIDSPSSRSAAFMIVAWHKDAAAAVDWLGKVGFRFSDLAPDGKFFLTAKLLGLGRWETALENTNLLHDDDFRQAPALFYMTAMANLVQAVPHELRSVLLQHVPFQADAFPLASDEGSLKYRRRAQDLFQQSAIAARELGCTEVANIAEDYAIWLELRDPKHRESGLKKLQESMRGSENSLRRLHLALQFGIKLDLDAVEREIARRSALSGGKSPDAAWARFSLAFIKRSPKDVADYIDRHRAQLEEHVGRKYIGSVEIEMLARSGLLDRAEERLVVLTDEGLSEDEYNNLRRIITEAAEADPINASKAQFESSGKLSDLDHLVRLLEDQSDWDQLCHFGSLLFERTKALPDDERLAIALDAAGRYEEISMLLRRYPELLDQSDNLQSLWSWSLYREGLLTESEAALEKLRAKRDHPSDRALKVNLAIASGEWQALLPFIEAEWANRDKRGADDLMRTAHLAHCVDSLRAKELVYHAVDKAPNNAHILVAAYGLATSAGWENEEPVAMWLHKAAELSDEKDRFRWDH